VSLLRSRDFSRAAAHAPRLEAETLTKVGRVAAVGGSTRSQHKLSVDRKTCHRCEPKRSRNLSREIDTVVRFIPRSEPGN